MASILSTKDENIVDSYTLPDSLSRLRYPIFHRKNDISNNDYSLHSDVSFWPPEQYVCGVPYIVSIQGVKTWAVNCEFCRWGDISYWILQDSPILKLEADEVGIINGSTKTATRNAIKSVIVKLTKSIFLYLAFHYLRLFFVIIEKAIYAKSLE